MASIRPKYPMKEFARKGRDWFQRVVEPQLASSDVGAFVAIDIDSGDYELDREDRAATQRLLARRPDAQIWLERAGQPAAYRIGPHASSSVRK